MVKRDINPKIRTYSESKTVHPTVLITGATGAVGKEALQQLYTKIPPSNISVFIRDSHKNRKLLSGYPGVQVFYGDITSPDDVMRACKQQDYVFHFAAIIPPETQAKPDLAWKVNVLGTQTLVKVLEEQSPNSFLLYSSSITVYGDRLKSPDIYVSDPLKPSLGDDYGKAKIEAESFIQKSKLNWSIFRLSAIMGIGNHKVSKLIFHVPLDTILEIATIPDTARAFVNSLGKNEQLQGRIFNLGGGEACRISYYDFMTRAFKLYGLGPVNFPKHAFATANFHCGNYMDGDLLEEIVEFRRDTVDSYFELFGNAIPKWQRYAASVVRKPVKLYLTTLSEPLSAYKKNNPEMIRRFFGDDQLT